MYKYLYVVCLCIAGQSVAADTPLTGKQFEQRVMGKTLSFTSGNVTYGAEEYLDDRRVKWSFLDGECHEGHWYDYGSKICFVYYDMPTEQCWSFFDRNGQIMARSENGSRGRELIATVHQDEPLMCLGPKVGA